MKEGKETEKEIMKYAIRKEFGLWRYMKPPVWKPMLPAMQKAMGNMDEILQDIEGIECEKYKLRDGVTVTMITPSELADSSAPCLIFYHGGGFIFPAYTYHYKLAAKYAREAGCKVAFCTYRLMPQYTYPCQIQDAIFAFDWIADHAKELHINPEKLAVGGDSAGGQLAAYAAFHAARKGVDLCFQLLIYPALDHLHRYPSMEKYPDTPMWNAELNRKLWQMSFDGNTALERSFPCLLDMDLPKMAPARVETAQFDCLHDDGAYYARKLRDTGNEVVYFESKGTMHGFEIVDGPTTQNCVNRRIQYMKRKFEEQTDSNASALE